MKPRINVITLGVDDLERSLHFYRDGLGFPAEGIVGEEFEFGAVVFIELQGGLKLALFPRKSLAHYATISLTPSSPTDLSIGYNVNSSQEVDVVMDIAKKAGANIVKTAQKTCPGLLSYIHNNIY